MGFNSAFKVLIYHRNLFQAEELEGAVGLLTQLSYKNVLVFCLSE